jgi:hypothetical protein
LINPVSAKIPESFLRRISPSSPLPSNNYFALPAERPTISSIKIDTRSDKDRLSAASVFPGRLPSGVHFRQRRRPAQARQGSGSKTQRHQLQSHGHSYGTD